MAKAKRKKKATKKAIKEKNDVGFFDFCFFILIIFVINFFATILEFALNIGILIVIGSICWAIVSKIRKVISNYFLPKTIKNINAEIEKIEVHQQGLQNKIDDLKAENASFENRKMTEASTPRTIKLVNQQIQLREQRISLFETILSLHQKRIQKLSVFKKEFALLRDLAISNKKYETYTGQTTQQYANLINEIDLNIKFDYATNIDDLVRTIEHGEGKYDTHAAIHHLTAIVEQELAQKEVLAEDKAMDEDTPIVEDNLEKLILEDLYKLRMEIQELKAA